WARKCVEEVTLGSDLGCNGAGRRRYKARESIRVAQRASSWKDDKRLSLPWDNRIMFTRAAEAADYDEQLLMRQVPEPGLSPLHLPSLSRASAAPTATLISLGLARSPSLAVARRPPT
ncbi:hypothetical protein THAOC_21171, partial [Thalassiosira oceanica]